MEEKYRDVPGFEGFYQCSVVDGSIKSNDVIVIHNGRGGSIVRRLHKGRVLKPSHMSDSRKHCQVNLCKDGVKYHTYQHDIVAKTFPEICGEWFEGCIVHHKDGNPDNNSPYNLQVLSRGEHMDEHRDMIKDASKSIDRTGMNGKMVLVYTTDLEKVIGCYDSATEAAKSLKCSPSAVQQNCRGTRKTCKGFYCEYI